HMMLVWDEHGWGLFVNGRVIDGRRRDKDANLEADLAFVEFGIPDKVEAIRGEPPRIEIDEVVGYNAHLRADEVAQAQKRWMGDISPIPLYDASFQYKWSISKLEFRLVPLLPEGVNAAAAKVSLHDVKADKAMFEVESDKREGEAFNFVLSQGKPLPYGDYQFRFQIKDQAGKAVATGACDWKFEEEPWRHCRAGILDKPTPPWTPIKAQSQTLETRMTRYVLGDDGLPREIYANGVNILKSPLHFLEDGKPIVGKISKAVTAKDVEAIWSAQFTASTCEILLDCRLEYDGMIRHEIAIKPKGKVNNIAFVMPIKVEHAKRWLAYPVGERGPRTGEIPDKNGLVLTSRADPASYQVWRAYCEERKKNPKLEWQAYWEPIRDKTEAYGFYTHVDINDMNRGLWWFCDNALGWAQSKKRGAVEIVRQGDAVALVLNLVAEPCDYKPSKPIVFGILPHPARPMPEKYRVHNKGRPDLDPRLCDVYDAFFPWAK
ncbi:MAG: DUF6067 family protein, partial [Planctomycetota bacterium]|nr:DUF6067 family protein [Planctomycetota bacterium]